MVNIELFKQTLKLSDQLIHFARKEDIAECARLLAINIAHYESVYGALPLDETLELAYTEEPNQAQIDLLSKGMETMIGVLGGIVQGFNPTPNH